MYGDVGTFRLEDATGLRAEMTFMVIAMHPHNIVRAQKPHYRVTLCLVGWGYWANGPVEPGRLIPVEINDRAIQWIDR